MKITGLIITLNEEQNLEACVASLRQICNEIIVVDSGSSDRSVEIARQLGCKTYIQHYLGDGIQKNVGLQYVTNPWVFSLDADERITSELVDEIRALDLEHTNYEAFAVRRKNFIGSRWVKKCHWYPDYLIRLYRPDKTRFTAEKQHAGVPSNNYKKLKGNLLHFTYQNIGEMFTKCASRFSSRSAKILYSKGKRANAFSPFWHGATAFFSNYIVRGGIFNGVDGFSVSLAYSMNSYLKYARLLEYQRDKKVFEKENFDEVW